MLEINRRNARIWSMLGMRRVLGMALSELAEQDERFVFVTADVARYFGAEKFAQAYPDRYIDVGIAEQNMVTVAAGLAKEGYHPLTATYATFTTARALDQVRVSLAYMGLPVLLVGVGGGLAEGDLSATHMGLEDVAVMRVLPKLTVIEPADCAELLLALQALIREPRPAYLRLTGKTGQPMLYRNMFEYTIGKANCLQGGTVPSLFSLQAPSRRRCSRRRSLLPMLARYMPLCMTCTPSSPWMRHFWRSSRIAGGWSLWRSICKAAVWRAP